MVRKILICQLRFGVLLEILSELVSVSFDFIFNYLSLFLLKSSAFSVIFGNILDIETVLVSKDIFNLIGVKI